MYYGAIVLAGGCGKRFHGKKQFYMLDGKPLWKHVHDKIADVIGSSDNIVTVGIDIPGGETRTESVRNGLQNLRGKTERVIIAEAARPLVTREQIKIILGCKSESVSFVMPLVNTVIGRDGTYYDRSSFYDLLTPQAFDYHKLITAYNTNNYLDMTDETRVMYEEYDIKPYLIETGDNLIKVTYPRDVEVIESLLRERPELR